MKTKELIEELQRIDPDGEIEVYFGADPISHLEIAAYYYDGNPWKIIKDHEGETVGMKMVDRDWKIRIKVYPLEDYIFDYLNVPEDELNIVVSKEAKEHYDKYWEERVEKWKKESLDS